MFTAMATFEQRLKPLEEMVVLDASCDDRSGITEPSRQLLVEGIRASLAILPVAFFEEFLRSIVRQYIDEINAKSPRKNWQELPEKMRRVHVFETLLILRNKQLSSETYDGYEIRILGELQRAIHKVVSPSVSPSAYFVAVEGFVETNSNPSSKTVNDMFGKLGHKDIFRHAALVKKMGTFNKAFSSGDAVRLRLDAIVERRIPLRMDALRRASSAKI